jgi:hypothetical protein
MYRTHPLKLGKCRHEARNPHAFYWSPAQPAKCVTSTVQSFLAMSMEIPIEKLPNPVGLPFLILYRLGNEIPIGL